MSAHNSSWAGSSSFHAAVPEPLPYWPTALPSLGIAWDIHIYGFGTLFFILCLCNVFVLVKLGRRLRPQPYLTSVLLFGTLLSSLRVCYLYLDPYQARQLLPAIVVRLSNALVYPSLAAMFSLLQIVILRYTNVNKVNPQAKSHKVLCGFITTYFIVCVVVTSVVVFDIRLKFLILFSQGIFISCGLITCFSFVYNGFRLAQFTSEANRALNEFNLYSRCRKEAIRNGSKKNGPLLVHRITKPRIRDEKESTKIEIDRYYNSEDYSSDSLSFCHDPPPNVGKCIAQPQHKSNINGPMLKEFTESNYSVSYTAHQNSDSNQPSSSQSIDSCADDHQQRFCKHYHLSSANGHAKVLKKRKKRADFEYHRPKANGISHKNNNSHIEMVEEQSQVEGQCHTNMAFRHDSWPNKINSPDKEVTGDQVPFAENEVVEEDGKVDHQPEQEDIIQDGGYMADTEPNSPKVKIKHNHYEHTCSSDMSSQRQQSSPSHTPYQLPVNDGSMGLHRILVGQALCKVHKFIYFATFFVFITCVLKLYAMFGVYGVLTETQVAETWPWFVYNTCGRLSEFGSSVCILVVTYALANQKGKSYRKRKFRQNDSSSCC